MVTGVGWIIQGVALNSLMVAAVPSYPFNLHSVLLASGSASLAFVAGYLMLLAPGGLGVRELILQQILVGELSQFLSMPESAAVAVAVAVVFRLVCLAGEIGAAAIAYWLPAQP